MKKKRKLWWMFLLVLVLVLAGVSLFAGNYLVNFAIVRQDTAQDVSPESVVSEEDQDTIRENGERIEEKKAAWISSVQQESVQITSEDGLVLKGDIFYAPRDSHKWLLAVHGYTGRRTDMQNIACFYGEKGYHVLTPDLRGQGKSGGKLIGMGWPDRLDLLQWMHYLIERFGSEIQIVLHGHSMGAATVMMAAGERLP